MYNFCYEYILHFDVYEVYTQQILRPKTLFGPWRFIDNTIDRVRLVVFFFAKQIGAPVDQIEERKDKRKRYSRNNVDSLRSRTMT